MVSCGPNNFLGGAANAILWAYMITSVPAAADNLTWASCFPIMFCQCIRMGLSQFLLLLPICSLGPTVGVADALGWAYFIFIAAAAIKDRLARAH